MIASAEEFVRLRTSSSESDYTRAAHEEAPESVWRDVASNSADVLDKLVRIENMSPDGSVAETSKYIRETIVVAAFNMRRTIPDHRTRPARVDVHHKKWASRRLSALCAHRAEARFPSLQCASRGSRSTWFVAIAISRRPADGGDTLQLAPASMSTSTTRRLPF